MGFPVEMPEIILVQFEDRGNPGYFAGSSYSYIAERGITVGDIVKVPTKYGDRIAKVVRTDVPIRELQCKVGQLRKIAGKATHGTDPFTGFFD
jgi:hypothetical protein